VENGWKCLWRFERKKLVVTLNMRGTWLAGEDTKVLTYDLPVKRELGGKKVIVLKADDDKLTLSREQNSE